LVDWRGTKIWADPLESRAVAIHNKSRGCYPEGIVTEPEYESLLATVVRELTDLKTPGGDKVFAEIHHGAALFHGPQQETAPDLVGILNKSLDVPASFRRDVRAAD